MAWRARKQQRREPAEDAMQATVSVHGNPLESVTGLPVQVSGVPGVSEGGMRGCEVLVVGSLCSPKNRTCRRALEHIGTQERLHLIITGEEKLQKPFGKTEMSGNALCRLVCRCIGWLHCPTLKPLHLSTQELFETRGLAAKPCNCQQRVGKLMFSALNMLDLQDALTYEKLESALTYVQRLLSEFVSGIDAIDTAGADRQWRQLRSL